MFKFRLTMLYLKIVNMYLHWKGSSIDDMIDENMTAEMNRRMQEYGFKPIDKRMFDA